MMAPGTKQLYMQVLSESFEKRT